MISAKLAVEALPDSELRFSASLAIARIHGGSASVPAACRLGRSAHVDIINNGYTKHNIIYSIYRYIHKRHIYVAGFPCQPFSNRKVIRVGTDCSVSWTVF